VTSPHRRLTFWGTLFLLGLVSVLFALFVDLPDSGRAFVLQQLRLPRVLLGFLVGATLGMVGAAFQTLFQNPLATPSTLGTTAGASLGAMAALAFGWQGLGLLTAATVFAFVGALVASSIIVSLSSSGRLGLSEILLAGIAITLGAGALSQALYVVLDERRLFAVAGWSLGQLPQVGFEKLQAALVPVLVCGLGLLRQRRSLAALLLGEDWAQSVGVATRRVRRDVLIFSCLGVATVVALCGPIAFVGLLVPHLVRPWTRGNSQALLPASFLVGGTFLVLCDLLARSLLPDRELPVGALTAALGAPALLWILLRERPQT
jgi:iron complex transport system permease protein